MPFELPPLPYAPDALAPHISEETIQYHYGKHHQAYVNKLNALIEGTEWADTSLEHIITHAEGGIFNNAAQIWNHSFYWSCLSPKGGNKPTGSIAQAINDQFGSFEQFKEEFTQKAIAQFGSGWAWLIQDDKGQLRITTTSNAGCPLTHNHKPLLTCDVWEHAYYIDTRNDRGAYLKNFWSLVNWDFAAQNLSASS